MLLDESGAGLLRGVADRRHRADRGSPVARAGGRAADDAAGPLGARLRDQQLAGSPAAPGQPRGGELHDLVRGRDRGCRLRRVPAPAWRRIAVADRLPLRPGGDDDPGLQPAPAALAAPALVQAGRGRGAAFRLEPLCQPVRRHPRQLQRRPHHRHPGRPGRGRRLPSRQPDGVRDQRDLLPAAPYDRLGSGSRARCGAAAVSTPNGSG